MMRPNISKYIIAIISCLCSLGLARAQESKTASPAGTKVKETAKEVLNPDGKEPFWQGLSVSVDLFGVAAKIFSTEHLSTEIAVEANIKNRFLPIAEIGFGTVDMVDDDKDIHYKTSAPYFRVGMNYNFMHKKETFSIIYAGLRYGFTTFSYDISAPDLSDPVWEGKVPYNYEGISCTAQWAEAVVGIRAQVWKNLHMGWSVRYKRQFSISEHPNAAPDYVPGYGTNDKVQFGASYNIIYYLPLGKKK